jgi:hypothetical protein
LISAGNDGAVFAWTRFDPTRPTNIDPASRTVIAHHTGAVTALAVAPEHVASAGRDALVIVDGTPTKLDAAATSLVFDDARTVHAVTRAGSLFRGSEIEIEQGVTMVVRTRDRWLRADADGTLVAR